MSTKVFDLYRYTGGDVASLLVWLKQLRVEYMQQIRADIKTYAPRDAANAIDVNRLQFRLERDTKLGNRSPFNVDASAVVYLHDGQVYVQFFAGQAFLGNVIEHCTVLTDRHYQNQSDQPDDVSDAEWEQRRAVVEAIGILDAPPSRMGLIFVFADESDIFRLIYSD